MNEWQILGIQPGATKEEVKRAYRSLAHKHHPDKGGDPEKFKEVSRAYQTLIKIAPDKPGQQMHGQQRNPFDFSDVADDSEIDQYMRNWSRMRNAADIMNDLINLEMMRIVRETRENIEKDLRRKNNLDPFRKFYGN